MAILTDNSAILARVRAYARHEALWDAGMHVLAAVSGGPDSVALLDLLLALDVRVSVAHVHHGLRVEAAEDAAFVTGLAKRSGVPFVLQRVDVPARLAATGESVETAARALRYDALQDAVREAGADRIATGHTADDQAETVLMRLLRGTGISGLAGIPPRRENIVRPLLPIRRADILAYLHARELDYRTDATNASLDFTRNRLRHELLPALEANYSPQFRRQLAHLAVLARQEDTALAAWTVREYAQLRQPVDDGIALPWAMELPTAIIWRLWRLAMTEVRGSVDDIGFEHLQAIQELSPGPEVHLPGVRVFREGTRLLFLPMTTISQRIEETSLPLSGCLDLGDLRITSARLDGLQPLAGGDTAVLDTEAIHGALRVRGWVAGDRFRPLGAPGSRKVQDIFVDAGVPKRLRDRIPLVFDDEGIVWLAGFRVADRVKMKPTSRHCLRICIEWELNPWTLRPSDDG